MSNNKEVRIYQDKVHVFIALQRPSKHGVGKKACVRHIIKGEEEKELKIFEAKLRALDKGEWRLHRTVNARDTKKAYNWFMKYLIDYPERISACESIWRTALLQRDNKAEKFFMLDIDTQVLQLLKIIEGLLLEAGAKVLKRVKSPSGWHYITEPFDIRVFKDLDYVSLVRDGYYFVKEIK